jgi:nucleotide-binding universal stress UspA family protein
MACILLATDGSDNSNRAADFAAQLTKSMGLALWILNVTAHDGLSSKQLAEFSRVEHVSVREMIESMSTQLLQAVKARLESMGGIDIHVETREGDVAQTAIETAQEKQQRQS